MRPLWPSFHLFIHHFWLVPFIPPKLIPFLIKMLEVLPLIELQIGEGIGEDEAVNINFNLHTFLFIYFGLIWSMLNHQQWINSRMGHH